MPSEKLSPTQPHPIHPAPYERQGSTEENLIDFTPELRAEAQKILEQFDHGPLSTPPTERGTILTKLQAQNLTVRISRTGSNYHALVASLHKRYSQGLAFDLNYTLSKYLDQVYTGNQNVLDQIQSSFFDDLDYGPSDFDIRHLLNINGTYDLPFGKGHGLSPGNPVLNKVASGWFIAGIFTARSGYPVSAPQNFQAFGGGSVFGAFVGAILQQNPASGLKVNSSVIGSGGVGINSDPARRGSGLNLFANPEEVYRSFRPILISQDRRTGRGTLRGLGDWNLNATIGKETRITEGVRFTLSLISSILSIASASATRINSSASRIRRPSASSTFSSTHRAAFRSAVASIFEQERTRNTRNKRNSRKGSIIP